MARMTSPLRFALPLAAPLALAACQQPARDDSAAGQPAESAANVPSSAPGDDSTRPYDGIAPTETLQFTGTEPFWGGEVTGDSLTYSTPENIDGETVPVTRFAGRGGLSFTGTLAAGDFAMTVTPGECSDGMSDRKYPFVVTLKLPAETRNGCGYTDRRPFTGPADP